MEIKTKKIVLYAGRPPRTPQLKPQGELLGQSTIIDTMDVSITTTGTLGFARFFVSLSGEEKIVDLLFVRTKIPSWWGHRPVIRIGKKGVVEGAVVTLTV